MNYHVGWNFPGYLPETEPMCFENESAALQCLQTEARSVGDEYYMSHAETCVASDEDYDKSCDCYWYEQYLNASGLSSAIQDGDFGPERLHRIGKYVYWVTEVNECECEDVYRSPVW